MRPFIKEMFETIWKDPDQRLQEQVTILTQFILKGKQDFTNLGTEKRILEISFKRIQGRPRGKGKGGISNAFYDRFNRLMDWYLYLRSI